MSILFLAFVITLFIFAVGFVFLNILSSGCPRLRDIKGCLILILMFHPLAKILFRLSSGPAGLRVRTDTYSYFLLWQHVPE